MSTEKPETTIKRQEKKKKKQTVLTAHLLEIVAEDKSAGTITYKEVSIPPLSKKGKTKSEKIVNGVTEASDAGDTSYNTKDFVIVYTNADPFAIRPESRFVSKPRN